MLSLTTDTFSWSSRPISSSAGAIIRQGPHHSAQKSTRTGLSEPSTSCWKLSSVTVLVVIGISWRGRADLGSRGPGLNLPSGPEGVEQGIRHVEQPRDGGVEQFRLDAAAGEDRAQRLRVIAELAQVWHRHVVQGGGGAAGGLELGEDDPFRLDQQPVDGAGDDDAV